MGSVVDLINLSIGIAGFSMTVLGLLVTVFYRPLGHMTRWYCVHVFSTLIVFTTMLFVAQVLAFPPEKQHFLKTGLFLQSLLPSLLMPLFTVYLLHLSGESWRSSGLFRAVVGTWLVYAILLTYTQFSNIIYYFDPSGVYHRGPLYPLLLVPPMAAMGINLVGLWRRRVRLTRKQYVALLVHLLLPVLGMLVQMFFFGILSVALSTVAAALVMLVFLLIDQQEQFIRQIEENAQKEFDIRILQMRPHFIYNALTSIYYITEEDPERGRGVLRDFTTYLRGVFDNVTQREPIPFSEELEHTRAYLSIEQARFEGQLNVVIDAPHTDFRLPPLTLQPIVENAVKHGMDPETELLTITVRTRAVNGGSEITVENDGTDFVPVSEEEADVGVGLVNTEARLRRMCGGSLKIVPRDGGGTVVTLWVPNTE